MGAPGSLTILDLGKRDPELASKAIRYYPDSANANLVMSWAASQRPSRFKSVAGGVAFVRNTKGYKKSTYQSKIATRNDSYFWREPPTDDGVMLILILPDGYIIPAADKTHPILVEAKAFKNRMALYWLEFGLHDIDFSWHMEESPYTTGEQLKEFCSRLNEEAYQIRKQANNELP